MATKTQKYFLGIDLGGTNIMAGVVDAGGNVLSRTKRKTRSKIGPQGVIDRITNVAKEATLMAKLTFNDLAGVGIGVPGPVNPATGTVITANNLRWDNIPLADLLAQKMSYKGPIAVDNDVNVGTWGEFKAGAGKPFHDVMGVFIGTGIGGGLVLNKKLYHGHFNSAGEIGLTLLMPNAQLGRRTLEDMASRTSMARLITQLIEANHPSMITELTNGKLDGIRSKIIYQAIEAKDQVVCRVVREACQYVGVSIANMVTMLSLPCVIIGGGLTEALGDTVIDWVRESFDDAVYPEHLKKCKIIEAALGDDAGLVGAALLAQAAQ